MPEPSASSAAPARTTFRGSFGALRHRNFAYFWWGALVSNTGTWVQNVTVPFVVFQLTDSPAWVGFAGFAQFFPAWLMGPVGGTLADRYPRRSVLLVCQALMAVNAFALWALWVAEVRSPWVVVALVAFTGLVAGVMIGSWQAFVSELVPRDDLLNAVTLNSAQFNAARAFGPAVGGVVLAVLSPSWAFFINAASFGAVLFALWRIRVPRVVGDRSARMQVWADLGSTVRYVRTMPGIMVCITAVLALGFFGSPVFTLIVVFAEDVFEVDADGFGLLSSALGLGAIIGLPLVAGWGSTIARSRLLATAMPLYGLALIGFAQAPGMVMGVLALMAAGGGYLAIASTLNTTIQLQVAEARRGKVLALYVMGLTGTAPLGALIQGELAEADRLGPRLTVTLSGLAFVLIALSLRATGRLRHLDAERDPELDRAPD